MNDKVNKLIIFSDKIKSFFFDNNVWRFIKKPGVLTTYWESSGTLKFVDAVLSFPGKLLGILINRYSDIFENSLFFKGLKKAAVNLHILIAVFLAISAAVPHLYWSNGFTLAVAILFLLLNIFKSAISSEDAFKVRAIDIMLFLFSLATILSAVASTFIVQSTLEFTKYHMPWVILVILMVSNITSGRKLGTFTSIVLTGIFASGVYGVFQYIQGIPVDPSQVDLSVFEDPVGRVYSTMHNANSYAEVIILTLPLFAGMTWSSKSLKRKITWAILAGPPFIALVLTQSRSGYIALAASAVVYVFFKNKKMIILLILAGLISLPFLPSFLYERVMSIFTGDSTVMLRISIFKTSLKIIRDFWFSGVGLGATPFIFFSNEYRIALPLPHSHNLFLEIWLETGILGIVTFLWFNIRLFKKCMLKIYEKTDICIDNLLISAISGLAGVLVFSLAEYVWFYPRVLLFYWVVTGIALSGLSILSKRKSDNVQVREEKEKT